MRTVSVVLSCLAVLFPICSLAAGQAHESVLYSFGTNPNDGSIPNGGLVFDSAGNLYGTTQRGGSAGGGSVFELSPLQGGSWGETVLYSFCSLPNCEDGAEPLAGLISDSVGNLYGTTVGGGTFSGGTCGGGGCGTVFELSPPSAPGASGLRRSSGILKVISTKTGHSPTGDSTGIWRGISMAQR
jgi:uncharacterized repeat protein (TIGR03803 family)